MRYGLLGCKEMLQHKMRRLTESVELECDGVSYTELLRRKRVEVRAPRANPIRDIAKGYVDGYSEGAEAARTMTGWIDGNAQGAGPALERIAQAAHAPSSSPRGALRAPRRPEALGALGPRPACGTVQSWEVLRGAPPAEVEGPRVR